MTATHLLCEYLSNPIGIGENIPRLSWWDESQEKGTTQTAYQILVASSLGRLEKNTGDLWDSGKVATSETSLISYQGKPLTSRQTAFWKVRVWDERGRRSQFSTPAKWEEGLLSGSDWKAQWIGMPNLDLSKPDPSPYARTEFNAAKHILKARIYASALGVYDLYLNGKRVDDVKFNPGFTDYDHRVLYQTFDVTDLVKEGRNTVGIILGDGWYAGHVGGWDRQQYGKQPMGLVQMELEYSDHSRQIIASSSRWKVSPGPIISSDFMRGEVYDARKELPNWCANGYEDQTWANAMARPVDDIVPVASCSEPVRQWDTCRVKRISEPQTGVYVADLGQNMVGYARLKVQGSAGQTVKLRFAEMLNPDGTIYTANLRTATSTDTYTLKGGGIEIYEPSFTFHGFRYVEITGYPGKPTPDSLTGIVVGSATPNAGSFSCSNSMVNQLYHNIYWGQRSNYLSIPTDCPQRDERLGWMGDAEVFVRTATYNSQVGAFMTKWLNDVQDGQSPKGDFGDVSPRVHFFGTAPGAPAWGDAGVIVPFTIYEVYNDKRILARHYEAMKRWVEYVHGVTNGLLWEKVAGNDYSDWLNINEETPHDVVATAYFAHSTDLLARSASILGKIDEARKYKDLYGQIRQAFNTAFVTPDGRVKGDTQTAYLLVLEFNLIPEEMRPLAAKHLVEDIVTKRNTHLATGFLGAGFLNLVLSETGNNDLAYRLLLTETYPSWMYPIKNGATTIWERWDGWTKEKGFQTPVMNSFNHYSLGAVGRWLYADVGGIDLLPGSPGYKKFVIRPRPGKGLSWAKTSYDSIHGPIKSDWKAVGNNLFVDVEIPANTSAVVYIPASSSKAVTEAGVSALRAKNVSFLRMEKGAATFEVGSGSYRFESDRVTENP